MIFDVARMIFDEKPGGPRLTFLGLNFEMNVGSRAPVIGNGFNCAKVIFTGGSGEEPTEALEIRVES